MLKKAVLTTMVTILTTVYPIHSQIKERNIAPVPIVDEINTKGWAIPDYKGCIDKGIDYIDTNKDGLTEVFVFKCLKEDRMILFYNGINAVFGWTELRDGKRQQTTISPNCDGKYTHRFFTGTLPYAPDCATKGRE
ncbi:MAG: hypothetical protein V1837_05275 [Candidatus Woesearchaeota archaeon]